MLIAGGGGGNSLHSLKGSSHSLEHAPSHKALSHDASTQDLSSSTNASSPSRNAYKPISSPSSDTSRKSTPSPLHSSSMLSALPPSQARLSPPSLPLSIKLLLYALCGGICAFYAFLIRSNGIILLLALLFTHGIMIYRHLFPRARFFTDLNLPTISTPFFIIVHVMPYVVFAIALCITHGVFHSIGGEGHESFVAYLSLKSFIRNVIYYLGVFSDFFLFPNPLNLIPSLNEMKYRYLLPNPLGFIGFLIACYFLIMGVRLRYKQDVFVVLFVLGTMAAYILWPALQGIRFVFCVLPFMALWIASGAIACLHKHRVFITRMLALTLLYFLITCGYLASKNLYYTYIAPMTKEGQKRLDAFNDESKALYAFIKEHTDRHAVIVFFKPRVLYLMTHRLSYYTQQEEKLDKADYYLDFLLNDMRMEGMEGCEKVWESERFVMYRLHSLDACKFN